MMDQIKYLLALESYKFMHTNIVHVRMIMINILYAFLVIYFPDVMPSLAALTGGTQYLPQNINGMNILPLFYGKQIDTDDRVLYWEFPGKQRAARHGDWKAVTIKPNKPLELYNLREDPEEKHDLAKKYPEMVIGFDKVMKEMRTPSENWPIPEDAESGKK